MNIFKLSTKVFRISL